MGGKVFRTGGVKIAPVLKMGMGVYLIKDMRMLLLVIVYYEI
jgi:hypothetical protein